MDDLREVIEEHDNMIKSHEDRLTLLETTISAHEIRIKNVEKILQRQMDIDNKLTELLEKQQEHNNQVTKRMIYILTGGFATLVSVIYLIVDRLVR